MIDVPRDDGSDATDAEAAFKDAIELVRRKQLRPAMLKLLDGLAQDPHHHEALGSAAKLASVIGDARLGDAFSRLAADSEDDQALFDVGYALVDSGRPDVAIAYLEECAQKRPDPSLLHYELAFAFFLVRRFEDAIDLLTPLVSQGALSPTEEVHAYLLKTESEIYALREQEARESLEALVEIAEVEEETQARVVALRSMIDRLARLTDPDDLQEWHFVQHGSLLLRQVQEKDQPGAAEGRALIARPGYAYLGGVLAVIRDLLVSVGVQPERVLSLSPRSKPLGIALAKLFEVSHDDFDGGDGLIIGVTQGEFANHLEDLSEFRPHSPLCLIALDWARSSSLCPDLVGMMATTIAMPWESMPNLERSEIDNQQPLPDFNEDESTIQERLELAIRSFDTSAESRKSLGYGVVRGESSSLS